MLGVDHSRFLHTEDPDELMVLQAMIEAAEKEQNRRDEQFAKLIAHQVGMVIGKMMK